MKTVIQQFYSLFREAMFANKLTAADISARKGVHYTYVYNSIRNNANLTLQSAQDLAAAAGYELTITFAPKDGSEPLSGKMDSSGPLFSQRRSRAAAKAETTKESAVQTPSAPEPAADLDSEIEALLSDV